MNRAAHQRLLSSNTPAIDTNIDDREHKGEMVVSDSKRTKPIEDVDANVPVDAAEPMSQLKLLPQPQPSLLDGIVIGSGANLDHLMALCHQLRAEGIRPSPLSLAIAPITSAPPSSASSPPFPPLPLSAPLGRRSYSFMTWGSKVRNLCTTYF